MLSFRAVKCDFDVSTELSRACLKEEVIFDANSVSLASWVKISLFSWSWKVLIKLLETDIFEIRSIFCLENSEVVSQVLHFVEVDI